MAAIYEYTGVVEKILPVQTFASGFTKRDVVLTDDVGQGGQWPNHIAFTFKKDNASVLNSVKEGQRAKIRFAIDGREWTNPQGQVKYFTDLTGLKLEVLNSDYIRTARAKGLKEKVVIYKHAFRNTMIPLVTSLAGLLPGLFSGAIITEQVFGLDGIGNIALNRMMQGDIPFIMGYNMFLAMLSVLGVLLSDLMYVIVDPRVKLD